MDYQDTFRSILKMVCWTTGLCYVLTAFKLLRYKNSPRKSEQKFSQFSYGLAKEAIYVGLLLSVGPISNYLYLYFDNIKPIIHLRCVYIL